MVLFVSYNQYGARRSTILVYRQEHQCIHYGYRTCYLIMSELDVTCGPGVNHVRYPNRKAKYLPE